jgi:hypothetical protein
MADILILRGISREDINNSDAIFTDRFKENIDYDTAVPNIEKYESIPSTINATLNVRNAIENWPQITSFPCWHCELPIKARPYPAITKMHLNGPKITFDVIGVFHGPYCAAAWIDREYDTFDRQSMYDHILYFHQYFCGKDLYILLPAPSRTIMHKYAGNAGISVPAYEQIVADLAHQCEK